MYPMHFFRLDLDACGIEIEGVDDFLEEIKRFGKVEIFL